MNLLTCEPAIDSRSDDLRKSFCGVVQFLLSPSLLSRDDADEDMIGCALIEIGDRHSVHAFGEFGDSDEAIEWGEPGLDSKGDSFLPIDVNAHGS